MLRKIQPILILSLTLVALLSAGRVPAAQAIPRATYWVVGSMSTIERATREQQRISASTGMDVRVVPAPVRGEIHYRLVVRAAANSADRELQKDNLEFVGVSDPWMISLDLPLQPVEMVAELDVSEAPDAEPQAAEASGMMAAAATPAPAGERDESAREAASATDRAAPPFTSDVEAATPAAVAESAADRPGRPLRATASTSALSEAGIASYKRGSHEQAIDQLTAAIFEGTESARIYYYRGCAHTRLREYELAIADFDRAIELNDDFSEAYNRRGLAKQRMGDREGALLDYRQALAKDPGNSSAMFNRGRVIFLQVLPILLILVL